MGRRGGRYEEALGIYREIGARLGEANCIQALGDVHYMLGGVWGGAGAVRGGAGHLSGNRRPGWGEANCIWALGGRAAAAARGQYEEALGIYREIGARRGGGQLYLRWGT
jgi:hypothetical protein